MLDLVIEWLSSRVSPGLRFGPALVCSMCIYNVGIQLDPFYGLCVTTF